MSFDGFYTHALTQELADTLIQGRIHKIYQPFLQELQIIIRAHRQNYRLQASIHPSYYRLHLTDEKPNNPKQAPMFCMLMRKHLENAIILDIQQVENDRIIIFHLSGYNEIGDSQTFQLIFELMGRHSNIVLINPTTEKIIDCIKHVPASQNTYRTLQAGAKYRFPPQSDDQINIWNLSQVELHHFAQENDQLITEGQGHRVIQGLSKLANKQILAWIQNGHTVEEALTKFLALFTPVKPTHFINNNKMYFYANDLPSLPGQRIHHTSLSSSLEIFYREKVHFDRIHQLTGNLTQRIEHLIERNQIKLQRLSEDRRVASAADTYKLYGELLSAYAYQINKGSHEAEVINYYDNQPIKIPLNSRKSPIDNSQNYYKKYSKYRDSLKYIDQQEQLTQQEIDYLETILVQIRQADLNDIEDIKTELQAEGYLSQHKQTIKKRSKTTSKPRKYRSSDGVDILVGRNNQQNDELSLRIAAKNHWWFHAKNIPGSHVIVSSDKPSLTTMTEAAEIAAYHSKSQYSANVPVDTLQVKYLRKPNGAKPGYVIYEGQETLFVTPDETKVKSLEVTSSNA